MTGGASAPPFRVAGLLLAGRGILVYAASMRRERLEYDVLIVGGGPAGLACALALAQAGRKAGTPPAICLLDKAASPGAHTLSGAIIDPYPLDALLPGWQTDDAFPLKTRVRREQLWLLSSRRKLPLPPALLPPMLRHEGQLLGPLSALVEYMARQAEAAGVELFYGFAASEPLFDDSGALLGVMAGEAGLQQDGTPGPQYEPGVEITARYVVLAEGARGNITRTVAERLRLFRHPAHHALGIKELWQLPAGQGTAGQETTEQETVGREPAGQGVAGQGGAPGLAIHTLGWPLGRRAAGGGFLYRQDARRLAVGLITHMDWRDPWLSPFAEMQRLKTHPAIRSLLEGAQRIGYGARAIASADVRDAEALVFPGGLLVGDAFGLVNVPRAQGVHAALESGRLAGEALADALAAGQARSRLAAYMKQVRASRFWRELELAANIKPLWARLGLPGALTAGALDLWAAHLLGRRLLPRVFHDTPDHATMLPAKSHHATRSPRPDGRLVFDRDNSLALSGVAHRRGQPCHLKILDEDAMLRLNRRRFGGPEQRYCPAAVYRWRKDEQGREELLIQAENCLHCKACDIKDPGQHIRWTPPEGGDGPHYRGM